jgi:hypothetical protein
VRIKDFAPGGFVEPPAEHEKTVVSSETVVYEAVEEVKAETTVNLPLAAPAAILPLHEVPRKRTTAGKGRVIRTEQEKVLEDEEGAWAAVRGERRGRWPRDRVVEEAKRRLRPWQTFMKELFCGSLMMAWMAATMLQLPVSQPDDLLDGFDYSKAQNQDEIMRQVEHDDPWLTPPRPSWKGDQLPLFRRRWRTSPKAVRSEDNLARTVWQAAKVKSTERNGENTGWC